MITKSGTEQHMPASSNAPPITFLVFDVDGTIVDNSPMIINLFQELFWKYRGEQCSCEEILKIFGPPEERIISQWFSGSQEEVLRYFLEQYEQRHPICGFLSFEDFRLLRETGFRLGLFTGKGHASLRITLRKLQLEETFDIVVCGSDVPRSKPHPDGLNRIIEEARLSRDQFLYVGDSPQDVLAARGAGIRMAAALWGAVEKSALLGAHPDFVFAEPSSLLGWLRASNVVTEHTNHSNGY